MRQLIVSISTFALLAAGCGSGSDQATVKLQFQPAAYVSDGFSLGPTDVAGDDGCLVPEDIDVVQVQAFGAAITDPKPFNYTRDSIDENCALNIFVPPGGDATIVIKAFRQIGPEETELVRKGYAFLPVIQAGESIDFPSPLWPAKRLLDDSEGAAEDLHYIEVMRQFDQFVIELAFDRVVYPATRQGADALYGFIEMRNVDSEETFRSTFDANSLGLPVLNLDTQALAEAEFEFIVGGIEIALPYAAVGGVDGSDAGVVDAPNLEFSITILDENDAVIDVFPNPESEEVATLN